jgi:hypothetical protein
MTRLALLLLLALAACDPVNRDAINALPGDAPGVRNGPLHRPGQPCLLCHDGQIGDPSEFSVAGTIFEHPGSLVAADNASVSLTDANGSSYSKTTNAAGNFYITPGEWSPVFPISNVSVLGRGARTPAIMLSDIGRDGACAGCHFDPAGPASSGHVSLSSDDGGTLP